MKLEVTLPADRTKEGTAAATFDDSSIKRFRCYGKSDSAAATKHGNKSRDPLKPYGDLPAGEYLALRVKPKPKTAANLRTYGPGSLFALVPVSGQALEAKRAGRAGLAIHGGAVGAPMPKDRLRPTNGCLRVDNASIKYLERGPAKFTVTVTTV